MLSLLLFSQSQMFMWAFLHARLPARQKEYEEEWTRCLVSQCLGTVHVLKLHFLGASLVPMVTSSAQLKVSGLWQPPKQQLIQARILNEHPTLEVLEVSVWKGSGESHSSQRICQRLLTNYKTEKEKSL